MNFYIYQTVIIFLLFMSTAYCQEKSNLNDEAEKTLVELENKIDVTIVDEKIENLVDSPKPEEAQLEEATIEVKVNHNIALLGAEISESRESDEGVRSKALKIYAVLLILLVTFVMGFASLFTSKAKSQ